MSAIANVSTFIGDFEIVNCAVSSAKWLVHWLQELFIAFDTQPLTTIGVAGGMLAATIRI